VSLAAAGRCAYGVEPSVAARGPPSASARAATSAFASGSEAGVAGAALGSEPPGPIMTRITASATRTDLDIMSLGTV
jgi:hypothetical protein